MHILQKCYVATSSALRGYISALEKRVLQKMKRDFFHNRVKVGPGADGNANVSPATNVWAIFLNMNLCREDVTKISPCDHGTIAAIAEKEFSSSLWIDK
jgi:hypothetical protein